MDWDSLTGVMVRLTMATGWITCAQDGTKLNDDGERLDERSTLHAEQPLCDNHVTGGGHRQELRQPFHDGNDDGFNPSHFLLCLVWDDAQWRKS